MQRDCCPAWPPRPWHLIDANTHKHKTHNTRDTPGLYRNPLSEAARFLSRFHGRRAKVWNLCSERLYDAAPFQGPVVQGRFAFDDHQVCG